MRSLQGSHVWVLLSFSVIPTAAKSSRKILSSQDVERNELMQPEYTRIILYEKMVGQKMNHCVISVVQEQLSVQTIVT